MELLYLFIQVGNINLILVKVGKVLKLNTMLEVLEIILM
jgi:hypothetical protein